MSAFGSGFSTAFDFSFVDTARERKAMLKWAGGSIPNRVFVPTGTVDAQARAVLLGLYGGNALASPSAPSGTAYSILQQIGRTILQKMAFTLVNIRRDSP